MGVSARSGWLVGPGFDTGFIVGIAALALGAGAVVVAQPHLFAWVLFFDIWLLGYHHVVSTYTRLCFDKESFAEHRGLVLYLPIAVFAVTALVAAGYGVWALGTIYFYWQWFHYTRQCWGIAQGYRRKSDTLMAEPDWFAKAAIYLVPLWGILYRSAQQPETFLTIETRFAPVPVFVADAVGAVACLFVAVWLASRLLQYFEGRLQTAHTLFLLSHLAVFAVGYVLIEDVTMGWVVINVWHNAQYIAFTWLYNNKRFKDGVTPQARLLSWLSQTRHWAWYVLACLALSTALYGGISWITSNIALVAIPAIVFYQAINFHHYIVDGLIWKIRKPAIQQTLGLTAETS